MVKMEKVMKYIDGLYDKALNPNHPDQMKSLKRISQICVVLHTMFNETKKKPEEVWSVS